MIALKEYHISHHEIVNDGGVTPKFCSIPSSPRLDKYKTNHYISII